MQNEEWCTPYQITYTKESAKLIRDKIESKYLNNGQIYLCSLFKAVLLTGYYGLLRIGEIATGAHPILACNIHVAKGKKKIKIVLKSSKKHPPQSITIIKNSNNRISGPAPTRHCPYLALKTYLKARGNYDTDNDPLFIFRDGSPIRSHHVRSVMKAAIKAIGLDESLYDTHLMAQML